MKKSLKICATVTGIFFIITLVVLVVLFVTILKPKEPKILAKPVSIESFDVVLFPAIKFNVSLGIVVTVSNPNYGGFKYKNSTSHVSYRGNVIAEAPIGDDTIPARRKHNISTSVDIVADKLATDSNFQSDLLFVGVLNFTSHTTLHGKVDLLKIFKMKATSYTDCNISIIVKDQSVDSICKSRVSL